MVFVGGKKWDDNVSGFTFWYDFWGFLVWVMQTGQFGTSVLEYFNAF